MAELIENQPVLGVWSSPFNAAARHAALPGGRVFFADCTLRDGEQQVGVVLTSDARFRIAQALDELGVYEIEAGTPAGSDVEAASIKQICEAGLSAKVSVLCRALQKDIDHARSLGAWGVRISYPVSRIERDAKLRGLSDEDYIEHALEITEYARDSGAFVIFSPYDTTRAELPFLQKVVREIEQAGTADRIRVVDTTGCALPEGVGELIRQIRLAAPATPLEIHCHDDFGLACANTVAAVAAGAEFVSTTMTGLGERSGNAATEEVAMVLEGLYRIDTGLRLDRLTDVARLVSELVGISPAPNKPVVGENSFRHESGMIVAGLLNNPFAAEPYRPELVGQHRQILLGKKSGLASLEYKLDELGLDVPEDALPSVLAQVKELAAVKRSTLTDADVASIVSSIPAGGPVR